MELGNHINHTYSTHISHTLIFTHTDSCIRTLKPSIVPPLLFHLSLLLFLLCVCDNISHISCKRDDHDYGLNDGDKTLSIRKESKDAFLGFFDAKETDPRRQRQGVYSSTLFSMKNEDGSNGDKSDRSVLVIALDMRYNKDPYSVEGITN